MAVLDDESKMRVALKRLLVTHGFEVVLCGTWADFLSIQEDLRPDCLLLDLHMPGASGIEVLGLMRALPVPVPTVVITGCHEPGNEELVRGLGASSYLLKPLDETTLVQAICDACQTGLGTAARPPDPAPLP